MVTKRRITINGCNASLFEAGEGQPLVLLVTPFILARTYRPTIRALARSFRVTAIEMPGSGAGGSRLSPAWDFRQMADWVVSALDQIEPNRPIVLVGHSNSGAVALLAAASAAPGRIASLILADTVGGPSSHSYARILAGRALDAILEPLFTIRATIPALSNLFRHTRHQLSQIRHAIHADLSDQASRVTVPTLLAWGRRDLTVRLRDAESLMKRMPNARLYVSERGGHDWIIVLADEFSDALARFAVEPQSQSSANL